MKISDLAKEHPHIEVPVLVKSGLIKKSLVTVITLVPNGKRTRQLEVNRYADMDDPVIVVLSDETVNDA